MHVQWDPFILTFKLATVTTVILFLLSVPLAYWLTYSRYKIKYVIEALVSLPLILPPSVLGFYLLLAFSPQNAFGKFLEQYFDLRLVFTFEGAHRCIDFIQPSVYGAANTQRIKIAPFVVGRSVIYFGKGKAYHLLRILLPNIRTSLITAFVLSFAHTVGEFGVVLMVGGNIPRETRVVSIALYDEVEAMNYQQANLYAMTLLLFAFLPC